MNSNIISKIESNNFKKYLKKYKLISANNNNNYIINLESLVKNNQKMLFIKLTHKLVGREITFYTEKSLEEIFKEIDFLSVSEFNTINSLIDYFSKLIKSNNITVDRTNNLIYNLYLFDNDKNKIIKFYLKRKIEMNHKNIEEIENEILNMHKSFENELNILEQKIEKLSNELIEMSNNKSSSIKNFDMNKFEIITFGFMINNINDNEIINIDNILKENNNNIKFPVEPINDKNKIIFNKEREKCELFTAFNLGNNHLIIVWTIKQKPNIINFQWNNDDRNEIEAHNNEINSLQYFHNENIKDNNDYIISLSKNDEDTFKIWNILNEKKLELFKIIQLNDFGKIIDCFCIFNNKDYSGDNSFIFAYYENFMKSKNNNEIICYKLDNMLNKIKWEDNKYTKLINSLEKIHYLDTFYYKNKNKLYLINSNERNVEIFENPLLNDYKGFYFGNNEKLHLSAFIVERNDNIELFETNIKGINIWDINNFLEPKIKIELHNNFTYDICLWNNEFLLASTTSGFQFIKIEEGQSKIIIDNCRNKGTSKVRKIFSPQEGYSIIGIDHEQNLSLWPIRVKKNNS